MKAKKMIALVTVMVMIFALSGVSLAIPSPTGSNIAGTSDNVIKVEVESISATKKASLDKTALEYISSEFGADYTVDTLLALDLKVTRKDNSPVTISLNVAGVKAGDKILVSHEKAGGSIEIVTANVLADGLIEFTLKEFSPISIVRVASIGAAGSTTMPKTGDNATAVPMVLLLAGCATALAMCGMALRKAKKS